MAGSALAIGLMLGCTRQSSHGPVQWTASNPSAAAGQTNAQAWSRSTSSDARQAAHGVPRAPVVAPEAPEPPPGVTNTQPATRWPYDGIILRLGPPP
jgi:hypothetical protein